VLDRGAAPVEEEETNEVWKPRVLEVSSLVVLAARVETNMPVLAMSDNTVISRVGPVVTAVDVS
jgi:hypothetical protein